MCRYYIHKYRVYELRHAMGYWFDGQLDIASYLGIHWHALYRKETDLHGLFAEKAEDV